MRKSLFVLIAAMTVGMTVPAFAQLQNVEVGGSLRIRGNWYSQVNGNPFVGPVGFSNVTFDDDDPDALYFEQRSTVSVKADFTDDVTAFIELDSYNTWGDDNFRRLSAADSGYAGGSIYRIAPTSGGFSNGTPVNLYQAYVEMNESWGYPITIRIGRSEMQHGSEFLVGNQDTSSGFTGLSFDGIWGTYTNDQFWIQAFWTRLAQNDSPFWEQSGDVDFMGLYGSYTGIEDMTIDAYYYYLHQAATINNAVVGLIDASQLHTIGARFAGNKSQFDWEANAAYQLGETGLGAPADDFNAFAVQAAIGYTFDVEMQPRVFAQGAYYSGDDEDASFRRLFSDHEYSEFLDGGNLTAFWFAGAGVSAQVTESVGLTAVANYFQQDEDTVAPGIDEQLGVEVAVYASYAYSEDLLFNSGFAWFFAMDGIEDTRGDDDPFYLFLESTIRF